LGAGKPKGHKQDFQSAKIVLWLMEEDINLNNYYYWRVRDRVMMFNATFDNISVISLRSFFWRRKPEYPEKNISP
jgi:hypothetical protein